MKIWGEDKLEAFMLGIRIIWPSLFADMLGSTI
jgi:hypothetical protein